MIIDESKFKASIVIFTFNRSDLLKICIESIISQSFKNYELIISDNCSTDCTQDVVNSFNDERIQYFKNPSNLGLRGNLEAGLNKVNYDYVILMGDDDVMLPKGLERTMNAFIQNPNVGMVTRPYYWFIDDITTPVRSIRPINSNQNTLIDMSSNVDEILSLFETSGQISGLAFKKKMIRYNFHKDIFTTHIYIFADLLKQAPVIFLKDYTVAVKINESMCRHNPEIYNKSPTISWVEMFKTVFHEEKYSKVKNFGIKRMANHCEGLIQIRAYSGYLNFLRELFIQVKIRPENLYSIKYLTYAFMCSVFTGDMLIKLTEIYKKFFLSRLIKKEFNKKNESLY